MRGNCLSRRIGEITAFLYMGGTELAWAPGMLEKIGVTSVLKLYKSPPGWPKGFDVCDMSDVDGRRISADQIRRQIEFIAGEIDAGRVVLVVSKAGMSGSSIAVLAYLVSTGLALPDAYMLLASRCQVRLASMVVSWDLLVSYFRLHYTYLDLVVSMLRFNWLPRLKAVISRVSCL